MNSLLSKIDQVLKGDELTLASNFSYQVNNSVINSINERILKFLFEYSTKQKIQYIPNVSWLDEGWEIFQLGDRLFKLALYIDQDTSYLNVLLADYPETKDSKTNKTSIKLNNEGKLKGLKIKLSDKIHVSPYDLCEVLTQTIDLAYKHANIDYQAALRDFCLAASGDELYDVLRKSSINPIIQKEISLYCVYNAMGRHIPSIDRVSNIVSIIAKGIPNKDLDPIRLAIDFFLTPLDGKKFELYTQKAFKENQTLTAKGSNYTGTSYVRIATEAFFKNADVTIQPIVKMSDEDWLLSAIYPSRFQEIVHPEIEKNKDEFFRVSDNLQSRNRNTLDKLKKLTQSKSNVRFNATSLGEFVGGVINAFIDK